LLVPSRARSNCCLIQPGGDLSTATDHSSQGTDAEPHGARRLCLFAQCRAGTTTADTAIIRFAYPFFVDPGNPLYVRKHPFQWRLQPHHVRCTTCVVRWPLHLEGAGFRITLARASKQRIRACRTSISFDCSRLHRLAGSPRSGDLNYKIAGEAPASQPPAASVTPRSYKSCATASNDGGRRFPLPFLGTAIGKSIAVNLTGGAFHKVYSVSTPPTPRPQPYLPTSSGSARSCGDST